MSRGHSASPPHRMIHEGILAGLLLAVVVTSGVLDPAFIRWSTQLELSTHIFEMALLALPMTLIIIAGGIDLSIGSTMALSAVTLGLLHEAGAPMWLACAAALAVGAGAGCLNGVFISVVRVHPLIVTLATLAAYRGLAEGISLGRPISGFPAGFLELGSGTLLGLPTPGWIFGLATVICAIAAWRSVPGLWVYALGDSERAAMYGGIPVARLKLALYSLSGAAAGLAGVLFVARRNTAKADIGTGIELEVITAVVLGGASISGGRGTVLGTLLGVALIHEVREFVSWHWQREELILIVIGMILIGSVLLNNLASRRRA